MNRLRVGRFLCLAVLGFVAIAPSLAEGQFCCGGGLPSAFSEQLVQAECAVLVMWVDGRKKTEDQSGSTEFEIVEVIHQPASALKDVLLDERTLQPVSLLRKRGRLSLNSYHAAKPGDLFLLTGASVEDLIQWNSPSAMTPTSWQYIRNIPKQDEVPEKRLAYFALNLGSDDKIVASDALLEMDNAAAADVVRMATELSRVRMRRSLQSCQDPQCRGWCIFLLGVCGTEDDAKVMEEFILNPSEEFRRGLDKLSAAYLQLTGERGLDLLEAKKLHDKSVPFFETYAAMQGVRDMWQHGQNRIPPERLRQSMRILLDRPELADLVVADLARMKDWSVQDRLMEMFESDTFKEPATKRAIIRFTLSAAKDGGANSGDSSASSSTEGTPAHVVKAQKYLTVLQERDPTTFNTAKRFFVLK